LEIATPATTASPPFFLLVAMPSSGLFAAGRSRTTADARLSSRTPRNVG
jgi:hypothetical protein